MPDLPPLTLDDIRVAGPDRDNAEAFEPYETWFLACGFVAAHGAEAVAGLLMELPADELDMVRDVAPVHEPFGDRKGSAAGSKPVAADGAEVALCRALNLLESGERWLPIISRASVYDLLAERDALKAALSELVYAAAHHNDALNTEDQPNGPQSPTGDDYNALLDMIEAAGASAFGNGEAR